MAESKNIATASIDPKSTVNVRKSQIEEGVEKLKSSIEKDGFWDHNPIIVRPHPDSSSKYEYEIVVGQCRMKACLELGREEIPAVVRELNDDEAIRVSWDENESRSDLTMVDKVYWAEFFYQRYYKQTRSKGESRRMAGEKLGCDAQTIKNWLPTAILPDDVLRMVDDKKIFLGDAEAIALSCVDEESDEELEKKITERVKWIIPLKGDYRTAGREVLKDVGAQESIEDLDKKLEDKTKNLTFKVTIPAVMRPRLKKWGDDHGLIGKNESTIGSNLIATQLSGK